jgi:hypothetical protein
MIWLCAGFQADAPRHLVVRRNHQCARCSATTPNASIFILTTPVLTLSLAVALPGNFSLDAKSVEAFYHRLALCALTASTGVAHLLPGTDDHHTRCL